MHSLKLGSTVSIRYMWTVFIGYPTIMFELSSMATNNETECLKIIEGREEEREREGQTDAVLIIKGKRERGRQT